MEKRYFTTKELSEYLGISKQTIYQWTSQHRIPFIKFGKGRIRFKLEKVEKWIKEHSIEPRNF